MGSPVTSIAIVRSLVLMFLGLLFLLLFNFRDMIVHLIIIIVKVMYGVFVYIDGLLYLWTCLLSIHAFQFICFVHRMHTASVLWLAHHLHEIVIELIILFLNSYICELTIFSCWLRYLGHLFRSCVL